MGFIFFKNLEDQIPFLGFSVMIDEFIDFCIYWQHRVWGLNLMVGVDSQLSPHISTDALLLILHKIPFLTRLIEVLILHQIKEGLWPSLAANTLVWGKYFALRVWPANKVGFWTSLHIYFARSALLKASKFLKHKPPWDLVSPSDFHFRKEIPFSLFIWPH